MKNIFTAILLMISLQVFSQISHEGVPYSKNLFQLKAKASLPKMTLSKLDTLQLNKEDAEFPTPYRYAVVKDQQIDVKTGLLTELPSGEGKIWRYQIEAAQATSLQLFFSKFIIPAGAKLFIYNSDYSEIYGAFTDENVQADSTFVVADFPGNSLIIEYFEPNNPAFEGQLIIGKVGQAYRSIFNSEKSTGYINVNCEQGADWQDVKHAVCKITFQEGSYSYTCSGTLLNNTRNDGVPYFLTANHCLSTSTVASTLVAYFNFENEGCSGSEKRKMTLTGSQLLNTSEQSDYTLLKLNSDVPSNYQPYYAGWDRSGMPFMGAVGIHHPEGLTKKIALTNDSVTINSQTISWDNKNVSPVLSHWILVYTDGKTGEGSSGSALFNLDKRVVGQLHGGNAVDDYYGRLSYSWTMGSSGYNKINTYLDPDNKGVTFIDGYAPVTNKPSAYFSLPSNVCKGAPIQLTDKSAFTPTSWNWVVSSSDFSFENGTTASSSNPVISFKSDTSYTVKLVVSNANGKDSMTYSNGLIAGSALVLNIASSLASEICFCKFDSVLFKASGATNYSWNVNDLDNHVSLSNTLGSSTYAKLLDKTSVTNTFQFNVELIGTQGSCVDTISATYSVVKPLNDDVNQAILLNEGKSISYSNKCATIEPNEPVPPITSCTSQYSWCNEYGNGANIIENTVWFKLIAPQSGIVSVYSEGMDNQMALYEASSSSDILNSKAVLLAANDDLSDFDSNPLLKSVKVVPGQTYWLQVDGSGGGSIGDFTLTVSNSAITVSDKVSEVETQLKVYPQPVLDEFTLAGVSSLRGDARINIYSMSGKLVSDNTLLFTGADEALLNVSNLHAGLYLMRIIVNQNVYSIKFMKK